MPSNPDEFAHLSDPELVAEVSRLARCERNATATLIASLVELDRRRLYLPEGFPSLFAYCTQRLHLSEHAAYHRIEAARAVTRFPAILDLLEDGAVTLTAVGLLRPHLTEENHREVLGAARHLSKRAVEELVAQLHPKPDLRASVRKLPEARVPGGAGPAVGSVEERRGGLAPVAAVSPAQSSLRASSLLGAAEGAESLRAVAIPCRPASVRASAPARYQVQMTVSAETHAKLRRAQDLLRHVVPNGDPAVIFERALTLLVHDLERKKFAARTERAKGQPSKDAGCLSRKRPRKLPGGPPPQGGARSRRIPASVKREVWARDEGQCAFVGGAGRCSERGFLEYHHAVPYAAGGETTVANISLRCKRHNALEAERFFGASLSSRAPDGLGPALLCHFVEIPMDWAADLF